MPVGVPSEQSALQAGPPVGPLPDDLEGGGHDEALPPVRITRQRRRPKAVKNSRRLFGALILLFAAGIITLIVTAASKMIGEANENERLDQEMAAFAADEAARDDGATDEVDETGGDEDDTGDADDDDARAARDEDDDARAARDEEDEPARVAMAPKSSTKKPRNNDRTLWLAVPQARDKSKSRVPGLGTTLRKTAVAQIKRSTSGPVRFSAKTTRGYSVGLVVDRVRKSKRRGKSTIEVRCRMTVAELPGKKLRSSSKASAKLTASGRLSKKRRQKLTRQAAEACAKELGKDFATFAKKRGR
jgi:hypothetical protein